LIYELLDSFFDMNKDFRLQLN